MIKLYMRHALGPPSPGADAFRPFRLLPILLATLAVLTSTGASSSAILKERQMAGSVAPQDDVCLLAPGETIKRSIKGGDVQTCRLMLAPKQYVHVVVEQLGVDVAVKLSAPDGSVIVEMDSPNGLRGPEAVSAVAQSDGFYVIEISADKTQPAGSYELSVEGPRAAVPSDDKRVAAEHLFMEAQKQRLTKTDASRVLAIKQLEEALDIWRELGDARGEGYTLCNIGRTYKALGKFSEAVEHLTQALKRLQDAQDVPGQAFALNEMGAVHRDLGNPRRALVYYERALELRTSIDDQWGQVQLRNNIGFIYSTIGDQQKAIEVLEPALPLWRSLGDPGMEMNTLNNIAEAHADLGYLADAFEQFQQVLRYCDKTGDCRLKPFVENSLGRIYDTWAEPQEALKHYDEALSIFRKMENEKGAAIVLDNIGMVYAGLGDAQHALEYFQEALKLRQHLKEPGGESHTRSNIGYAQTLLGNYQEALDSLKSALALSIDASDKPFEAYTLVRMGMAYASLGKPEQALETYRQALKIQEEIEDRRGQAITLDQMGQVYAAVGESAKARDSYGQASRQWLAVGDKQGEALSLYGMARVELDRHNLTNARNRVEEAITIIESLRSKLTSHQLRMTYFAGKQDFYALDIEIRMQLYELSHSDADMEEALSASERARARNLLDLLSEAHVELNKGISSPDAEKNHRLEHEIGVLAQNWLRLRNLKRMEDAVAVEEKLRARIDEQDKLQTSIRTSSASYAGLKQPRPLAPLEIRQLLDDETILLEYSLAEGHSYLWAVTREKTLPYLLPGRSEIEKAAEQLRQTLIAYEPLKPGESRSQYLSRWENAATRYPQVALELSQMVLGPVASQLGNKRLVIVADGALQYIPFEALPLPSPTNSSQPDVRGQAVADSGAVYTPLLLRHEVVYQPSASTLALLRDAPHKKTDKTVAVLADPVFDSIDDRVRALTRRQRNKTSARSLPKELSQALRDVGDVGAVSADFRLARLRHTAEEAQAITTAAPNGSWMKAVDFKASRATAMSPALGQYSIVHFATHGILNDKHPELSGIVLSMVSERGEPEDGYLRLGDIYKMSLPVDLVVLSACRTGIGKQVRGEGLISLTRGFMYAGASRVVASLWKVDDEATTELMKRFYRHMLKQKMPAATALRQAKIEMSELELWRAPFYWAGFVLQGDWK
jgi:CHAT domain-containing protein/tetratricopeptide (TPR) repeat protein